MSKNYRWLRRVAPVVLGVLIGCLDPGASGSFAAPNAVQPCITPTQVNLNETYGVSDAIVAPFCTEVSAGRRWTVSNAWFMSPTFDVVPEGFVPAGATPLEDFIAKFVGVKYVIDPGTSTEKVYVLANDDDLGVVSGGGFVVANPISLGSLKSLSIGEHVVESYLLFSAMHCDGIGQVVVENCLGPGEVLFPTVQFSVTPGHN